MNFFKNIYHKWYLRIRSGFLTSKVRFIIFIAFLINIPFIGISLFYLPQYHHYISQNDTIVEYGFFEPERLFELLTHARNFQDSYAERFQEKNLQEAILRFKEINQIAEASLESAFPQIQEYYKNIQTVSLSLIENLSSTNPRREILSQQHQSQFMNLYANIKALKSDSIDLLRLNIQNATLLKNQIERNIIIAIIIFILIFSFLILKVSENMFSPLIQLASQIELLRNGKYSAFKAITRQNEFRPLFASVRELATTMRERDELKTGKILELRKVIDILIDESSENIIVFDWNAKNINKISEPLAPFFKSTPQQFEGKSLLDWMNEPLQEKLEDVVLDEKEEFFTWEIKTGYTLQGRAFGTGNKITPISKIIFIVKHITQKEITSC